MYQLFKAPNTICNLQPAIYMKASTAQSFSPIAVQQANQRMGSFYHPISNHTFVLSLPLFDKPVDSEYIEASQLTRNEIFWSTARSPRHSLIRCRPCSSSSNALCLRNHQCSDIQYQSIAIAKFRMLAG
jgi:hypothetical protein